MTLSVCLLTRNEEHSLPRALGSVRGLAEEVIVADTGSSDATARVARELGARVIEHDWQDDFARARDHALSEAKGDWILWLNPDEELLEPSRDVVIHCMTLPDAFAFYALIEQMERPDQKTGFAEVANLRLFRNDPDLHSIGRLHPSFDPSLETLAARQGMQVFRAPIVLRRHLYLSPVLPEKLRWAARLFKKELEDRPGQLHYLIEYGHTLLLLGEPEGHAVMAEAIEILHPKIDAEKPPVSSVQNLFDYILRVDPVMYRGALSKEETRELAVRWFPNSPPLLWRLSEHAFARGDFQAATPLLERLVELGHTRNYDHTEAFDPAIVGTLAQLNLAACRARLGNFKEAEHILLPLLNDPDAGPRARELFGSIQQMRGRRTQSS